MKQILPKMLKLTCMLMIGFLANIHAATFVVDSNGDTDNLATYTVGDGTNTLRKCIRLANANANAPIVDIINFNLGGVGPFTITLGSNLPIISEPVDVNGYSQTGSARPAPYIMISATGAAAAVSPINNIFYIASTASNSKIRGFSLVRTQNDALYINGAANCFIDGCWIGLDQTAAQPIQANSRVGGHGVYLFNFANNCTIGGVNSRNVISGNTGHGIVIISCSGVKLLNNYIGTSTNGNTAIANGIHGVTLDNSTSIVIGSSNALESNVISGNAIIGINVDNRSHNYQILGNRIGTNLSGTAALANGSHGINVSLSNNGIIGGATTASSNIVSGNGASGVVIYNTASSSSIKGNKIGVNQAGTAAIPNGVHGISMYSFALNNTIGGVNTGEGNLISGNLFYGINIDDNSHNSLIQGNKIGTDVTGSSAIGNGNHGIFINVTTGTSIGGNSKYARNVISGNGNAASENGIAIQNSNYNTIKGNFIGVSYSGLSALGNYDTGISMSTSAFNTIGGSSFMERNVVSGHNGPGGNIGIWCDNVDNSFFASNFIGTDSAGLIAMKNNNHGIHTQNGSDKNYFISNVVSGNGNVGMDLIGLTNSFIYGNYVGLAYNGTTSLGNTAIGIRFGSSNYNKIGGAALNQRNYVSSNGDHAIFFDDGGGTGGSTFNSVQGNYIGTDTTGLVARGNQKSGVIFISNCNNNLIGGSNTGEGNLICCSVTEDGVRGQISPNATIMGNLIGTNKLGVPATGFGNAGKGVYLMSYSYLSGSSSYSIIGGLLPGQANTITNNGGDGVRLADYGGGSFGTKYVPIIGNKIYCNGGYGINFETGTAGENEAIPSPNVISSTTNSISGTGVTGNVVHIYRNSYTDGARCDCEGEIYVGTTTVVGGSWSFTHNLGLSASQAMAVTATQTNPSNSTSKFWVCTSPLPIDYLSLVVFHKNTEAIVEFTVRNEISVSKYYIQRSVDGSHFEEIGFVNPKGAAGSISYQFNDENPLGGNSFYRIKIVDLDGRVKYSTIYLLKAGGGDLVSIYPNPASNSFKIRVLGSSTFLVSILNMEGKVVREEFPLDQDITSVDISNLSAGVYFVLLRNESNSTIEKLIVGNE